MLYMLARNWWLFAVRGIAAMAFGILAFLWPGLALGVLVLFFGLYAVVDGAALLIALIRGEPAARRSAWAVAVMGVLGVVAGIVAFILPGITALSLLFVVAFWAIVMGALQIWAAIALRKQVSNELWMIAGGVISVIFGVYLVILPGAGLVALVWLVALWSILFGVANLAFAFRVRRLAPAASAAPA